MFKSPLKPSYNKFLAFMLCASLFSYAYINADFRSEDSINREKAVMLIGSRGACSGEQVEAASGQSYILTAAHCRVVSDDGISIETITEDGRHIMRRIVAEDPYSDLMLLEGVPNLGALKIGTEIHKNDHVKTYTHGKRHATYKTEGDIMETEEVSIGIGIVGENGLICDMPKFQKITAMTPWGEPAVVCVMTVKETFTTAMVVPGSSGGMVLNDHNELIGVVSAGDGNFGLLVRLQDIRKFLSNY